MILELETEFSDKYFNADSTLRPKEKREPDLVSIRCPKYPNTEGKWWQWREIQRQANLLRRKRNQAFPMGSGSWSNPFDMVGVTGSTPVPPTKFSLKAFALKRKCENLVPYSHATMIRMYSKAPFFPSPTYSYPLILYTQRPGVEWSQSCP